MTTTTDLTPGDIVQHSAMGYGIYSPLNGGCIVTGRSHAELGRTVYEVHYDLTGWERVDTCTQEAVRILEDYQQVESESVGIIIRGDVVMMSATHYKDHTDRRALPAGHVAIRTDDLDLNHPEGVRALWLRVQRLATDPVVYESYEEWAAANNSRANEVIRPGHVQVRVDDLDLRSWGGLPDDDNLWGPSGIVAIRAAKAKADSRKELAQPDEPQEFGARVKVDGRRWCRQYDGRWANEYNHILSWPLLLERGAVTLGWGEDQ